ncbi:MAG: DUF4838 domain-containing protein [Lentisphaerae bacterium]|nr:DUF4838 domain-containing protein [Lentisphaerota bacterium]
MKKFLIFCAVVGVTFAAFSVPEYLVTGKNPSRLEKLAEKELLYFYRKIYQRELKKISSQDAKGKKVIFLGDTEIARNNGFAPAKFGKEEWMLKTVGKNLVIAGGRPAGTLYGVYELLERLGTAFLVPGEVLLPDKKVKFPRFDEKRKPAFAGRLIWDGTPTVYHITRADENTKKAYLMWILRNRINGGQTSRLKPVYTGDYFNLTTYPYHNLDVYVPPEKYFKTHPEYFRMDEFGKRVPPKKVHQFGSLCMANSEVKRVTLESLRNFIRHDRKTLPEEQWPLIYDISELDATDYICRCPECKKVIAATGSESDLLLSYINYIATEIRKEYPEIIIRTSTRRRMPGKLQPAKNVLMTVGHSFFFNPFKPFELKEHPDYAAYFHRWQKISSQLQIWDYWNLGGAAYQNPPRVETVIDSIQPDLKFFLENKVVSMFIENGRDRVAPQNFYMLNCFVGSRLLVDIDADVEMLIEQFFKGYYGPAAPVVRKYFDLIRAGIKKYPQKDANSITVGHWKYLTAGFLLDFYSDLKKAAAELPAADARFAKRVRHELISPLWYILAKWHIFEEAFTARGISRKQLIEECRRYVGEYICRYPLKNPQVIKQEFEKRFSASVSLFPRPEKFKNIPDRDFRMLVYSNFRTVPRFNAFVVKDSDSLIGYALKSAYSEKGYQGVNVIIPTAHKFNTTFFEMRCYPGSVSTTLRHVYQDEKYHWYRLPGSVVLSEKNVFWGQGWAVQARADQWFTLTNGDPKDNTWEQIWFSAKFTGPAYVPGSKKQNAIYVDMLAAVRNSKDPDFTPVADYTFDGLKWQIGKKSVKSNPGTLEISRSTKQQTVLGPVKSCTPDDVIILKLRSEGSKRVGCYFYDAAGKMVATKVFPVPDTGRQNEYVFKLPDMNKRNIRSFRIALIVPAGRGICKFNQLQVLKATGLNMPETVK